MPARATVLVDQLVDAAAIAARLGFDQAPDDWRDLDPGFPDPLVELSIGPVWEWWRVARWAMLEDFEIPEGEELAPHDLIGQLVARHHAELALRGKVCPRCALHVIDADADCCAACERDHRLTREIQHETEKARRLRYWHSDKGRAAAQRRNIKRRAN